MKLIIQPADGVAPLLCAIKGAKKSVEIAVFRFDRKDLEAALKAAAEKGVRVTALIADVNRGGEKSLRKLELRFLEAGIIVARTAGDLLRYHDKFILIDRQTLYVLSFNFTRMDMDRSRGFGVITRNVKWVHEAVKLFRADCTRTRYAPKTPTFVVSPANSREVLGTFLKRARKQLLIYDPRISDKEMLRILQDRAKAGVEIRIIGKVAGKSKFNSQKLAGSRLHTRTIIRDRQQAFVGSQSLRAAELDSRRELGLIINDAKIVKQLADTFAADWTPADAAKEQAASKEQEILAESPATSAAAETEKAAEAFKKELDPLASAVKKAVRKAVAKAGEEVLGDSGVKDTVKKVVKKAMKQAVKEAVAESKQAQEASEAREA